MHALTPVISLPSIDSVDSLIDFSPLTVTPDTSLFDVVTLMNRQQANYVLVTDEMRVLGWFTNQDVISLVCCGFDFQTVQISQVMVTSVITLEYHQAKNLAYLLLFFQKNNLSLLPIVDQQNKLVGLITLNTIFHNAVMISTADALDERDISILNWFATNTDIHDLKLAESELRQTQAILQAILDNSPAIISVLNTQNKYLLINREYEKVFQITQEEARDRSIYDFFPRDIANNFAANNHNVLISGTATEVEEIIPQDNALHTYLSIKFPLKDGNDIPYAICSISTNITERKRTEESLRLRDRAINASSNGIVISDARLPNLPIIYANPAFEDITGYSPENVIGRNCSFLQGIDTNQPEIQEIRNAIKQAKGCTVVLRNYRRDGSLFWNELSISPVLDADGKCTHYVGIQNDITERKQTEQDLRTALEKEKELNELKSRFITTTSHEFRTPLTTILSSSELLEHYHHKWTEEKLLFHIRRIQTSVKHMTDMLNDVLVIGKAEVGRLDFKPVSLDLVEYCHDLIQELQQDGETEDNTENAIAFHCEYESMHCRMDKNLLGHILRNLLTNAIKYSFKGSTIQFTLTEQENRVVFEVKDQGIGIPQEDLPLLFDSFHRAANVGNIPGTGLGLSIVKKCVDLHQGKIFVHSEVEVGTTFTVILPLSND
ncbi:MAG: PAS domain S-box protein [Fischerella sp. CENA71]|nr:PAS domain S-box protein [Fischerella sp. CENA71]